MKTREKSDKSIFRSIFISYCIACIIILGITGLGYANYYRLFKENTVAFARQQADMVTTQVERGFIKIQQALGTLSPVPVDLIRKCSRCSLVVMASLKMNLWRLSIIRVPTEASSLMMAGYG